MIMNPTLVALFGPLQGSTHPIPGNEVSIGRDTSNWICIPDPLLSRHHCKIHREGDTFTITDQNSLNGIFINDIPVKEKGIRHGDQIEMGDSLFLFLLKEDEPEFSSSVSQLEDKLLFARSTVRVKIEDALYLKPERIAAAIPDSSRIAQYLNVLLKINMAINSIPSDGDLPRKILEFLFQVIPAERGALLLGKHSNNFAMIHAYNQKMTPLPEIQVSRTIAAEVFRENVGILGNDILHSQKFQDAKSLISSKIRSLLCVPLTVLNEVLGILYLDTTSAEVHFDEDHLQLVTAIGCLAAISLRHAAQIESLAEENRSLKDDIRIEHSMVGEGPAMQKVYQLISRIAPTDSTVLLQGESGTGKELAARAIHLNSSRATGPFVAINCAALPDTLLESELFGHEKGAFTGAVAQKKGKIELAEGGTLFLDEISEIEPSLQVKLLRMLQEREFERVGGTRSIHINVRIVAATNSNLQNAIQQGLFRQDLYYRLNVVSLTMPPLRDRREDILLLANYFVSKFSKKLPRRVKGIAPEAQECLLNYDWPGNVRELENSMERAVVLGSTDLILSEDLPESLHETATSPTKYHEVIQSAKKDLILKTMEACGGNYNTAAQSLGLHPNYLYRLIRNLKLRDSIKHQ